MAKVEIKGKASLDTSAFDRGVSRMMQAGARLKSKLGPGMLAAAVATGAAIKQSLTLGDRISDMASRLGITTDEVQALEDGFRNAGGEASDVEAVISTLGAKMKEAAEAGPDSAIGKAFAPFVDSFRDVSDLDPAQMLDRITAAWRKAGYAAGMYANITDLIGRSGKNLPGVIRAHGADGGTAAWYGAAQSMGRVASPAEIAALGKTQDTVDNGIDTMRKAIAGVVGRVAAGAEKAGEATAELFGQLNGEQQLVYAESKGLMPPRAGDHMSTAGGVLMSDVDAARRKQVADEEDAAEAKEVRAKTEQMRAEMAFEQMTEEQKYNELYRQEQEQINLSTAALTDTARARAEQAALVARDEIRKIEAARAEREQERFNTPLIDRFAHVGGRLRNNAVAEKQETHLRHIAVAAELQLAELQKLNKGSKEATF